MIYGSCLFNQFLGILGAPISSLFILGIFTKKANYKGALIGFILNMLLLMYFTFISPISPFFYSFVSTLAVVIFGYIASLIFNKDNKNKNLDNLTVYTMAKGE